MGVLRAGKLLRKLAPKSLEEKDAHWNDAFARESGRFGSHPLHDDYSDESAP
jgi:hypothetical protein